MIIAIELKFPGYGSILYNIYTNNECLVYSATAMEQIFHELKGGTLHSTRRSRAELNRNFSSIALITHVVAMVMN